MSASMLSMEALLTMWLPAGITAMAAWRMHRRRPEVAEVADPARRALERLLGTPEEIQAPVRLVPRRQRFTVLEGGRQDCDAA